MSIAFAVSGAAPGVAYEAAEYATENLRVNA